MAQLILLNKPFQVLSQFSDDQGRRTLRECVPVPGVYPAGRLDWDSEGLLLLTDDGALQARISDPRFKLPKTYLVQVEGKPGGQELQKLRQGITLKDGPTRPAKVELIEPPALWPRNPPVRSRKTVPDSWLKLTIDEGRPRRMAGYDGSRAEAACSQAAAASSSLWRASTQIQRPSISSFFQNGARVFSRSMINAQAANAS